MATLQQLMPFALLRQRLIAKYPIDYQKFQRLCRAHRLGEIHGGQVFRATFFERIGARTLEGLVSGPYGNIFLTELTNSLNNGCLLWIFHTDDAGFERLCGIFGTEHVHLIERFEGALSQLDTHPYAVQPETLARILLDRFDDLNENSQKRVKRALTGIDTIYLDQSFVDLLEEDGIPYTFRSKLQRFIMNPRVIAYIVVFVYSALRVLPVHFVEEFHGELWKLWTIDMVTAIPYTWGVLAMVTARTKLMRWLGLIVTVVTFVSPYIYFWSTGDEYPLYVNFIVLALIATGILFEGFKYIQEQRLVTVFIRANWKMRI